MNDLDRRETRPRFGRSQRGSWAPPTSETYQLLHTIDLLRVISFDFQLRNYIGTIADLMPKS